MAVVANGSYTHAANQMTICNQLEQLPTQAQNMAQNGTPINHLQLIIIGTKVEEGNTACTIVTIVFAFLLFPIFFFCCNWWKKITNPKWEINTTTYQAIANAVNSLPSLNNFSLTVADNGFNSEKAQILHNIVKSRKLAAFTFINMAREFDWREEEFSRFRQNMQPIHELGVASEMKWGEEVVGL